MAKRNQATEYQREDTITKHLEARVSRAKFEFDGCKPCCIGICVIDGANELYAARSGVDAIELASWLGEQLNVLRPVKLIGFNVLGFDLPIMQRWMARSGVTLERPFGRYDVVDLMNEVAGFGKRVSLDRACRAYAIPTSDSDGSMVEGWYVAKNMQAIERYCLEDVNATVGLYRKVTNIKSL